MRASTLIGLILFRGGLALAGGYSFFRAARYVLQFIELPWEVEVGGALMLSGLGLVMVSLVMERYQDMQAEKELS